MNQLKALSDDGFRCLVSFGSIRKAEETRAKLKGLGPLDDFLRSFYHHFHARSRPSLHRRAAQYVSGLFQLDAKRNLSKLDERAHGSEYQALHHFLTYSPWDDDAVCKQISQVADSLIGGTADTVLIIDPSAFSKKGNHSVGVARQYNGHRLSPQTPLAYQQNQRFWVEQAIRDQKDGLGMDEYHAGKWRSWHHHIALTLLTACSC